MPHTGDPTQQVHAAGIGERQEAPAFPTVGIGASAGGVMALQNLFEALPPDLGAAYVVIVHLAPDHQSELATILASRTKMSVIQVRCPAPLEPNCVYVIPPNKRLVIANGEIGLADFAEPRGKRAPIDQFFRSLAENHGDGFAVVLTGAGSDGTLGVKAIKEAGGIILVQDPREAEYASMPRNAIATGVADFVLPISGIAMQIAKSIRAKEQLAAQKFEEVSDEILLRLLAHLRGKTGHDFSNYKRSTVLRRIKRRMQVRRIEDIERYVDLLGEYDDEAHALLADLLISVTTFFRDPAAFDALSKHVIRRLFENKGARDSIRVWVPGCATGEEAYTIAMLLQEEATDRRVWPEIQIFASDLDAVALAGARQGRYPAAIEADLSEERLRRFFFRDHDHYVVKRELRELVLFASHSVLKDPPFSKLDLVSCRNLLIYLDRDLQQQVVAVFHYALRPGGFLFLGPSEGAETPLGLFTPVDRDARIYRVNRSEKAAFTPVPKLGLAPRSRPVGASRAASAPALIGGGALHHWALETAAPPSVLIDRDYKIVNMSENAGRFLQHPGGAYTSDLTEIVRPELRAELRAALGRAREPDQTVLSLGVQVQFNGTAVPVFLQIRPLEREGLPPLILVIFVEGGARPGDDVDAGDLQSAGAQGGQLHRELELTRARLKNSQEEYEAANEELRAANEELESINEEYRSIAEELETSKEELQSINEELQTVNNELKLKLENVLNTQSDLQNLITATDVGTLFLDAALRIKRFTPRIGELFSITDADEGRPITDFTHRLHYDRLIEDIRTVAADLAPVEREVNSHAGRWYLMRLRPYRTMEDKIEGVVATFVDVTARRAAEEALRQSEARLKLAREASGLGIHDYTPGTHELWLDERSRGFWGFSPDEPVSIDMFWEGVDPGDAKSARKAFEAALRAGAGGAYTVEFRLRTKPSQWICAQGKVFANVGGREGESRLIGTLQDISDRKAWEAQQRLFLRELSDRAKNTLAVVQSLARQTLRGREESDHALIDFQRRLRALSASHEILVQADWQGADLLQLARRQWQGLMPPDAQRLTIAGPQILLPPNLATPFGMLLHELATNASKYGAHSGERGTVSLTWDVSDEGDKRWLDVRWQELGGPPVNPPERNGFGSFLIENGIAEAEVKRNFRPEGLLCTLRIPLHRFAQRARSNEP